MLMVPAGSDDDDGDEGYEGGHEGDDDADDTDDHGAWPFGDDGGAEEADDRDRSKSKEDRRKINRTAQK